MAVRLPPLFVIVNMLWPRGTSSGASDVGRARHGRGGALSCFHSCSFRKASGDDSPPSPSSPFQTTTLCSCIFPAFAGEPRPGSSLCGKEREGTAGERGD